MEVLSCLRTAADLFALSTQILSKLHITLWKQWCGIGVMVEGTSSNFFLLGGVVKLTYLMKIFELITSFKWNMIFEMPRLEECVCVPSDPSLVNLSCWNEYCWSIYTNLWIQIIRCVACNPVTAALALVRNPNKQSPRSNQTPDGRLNHHTTHPCYLKRLLRPRSCPS